MRTGKSVKNMMFGVAGQLLVAGMSLVNRTMLARLLPADYLGLTGLFGNIFSLLDLTELGIGSAMIYALYGPVAQGDIGKQQELMNYYRRLYRLVALAVLALGLMLIPFLDVLVNTDVPIDNLLRIYLMYLVQAAGSYLYVYKTSIIVAHQNQYICTIYSRVGVFFRYLAQFAVLYITRDYLLYLAAYILFTMLPNLGASQKAEKLYPYIRKKRRAYPGKEARRDILKNVKALFFHKLGTGLVYGTDNILMSSMAGLSSLGVYSNYSLITGNVSSLGGQIFDALSASIGNLVAKERNQEHVWEIYKALHFCAFLVFSYCTVAMAVLFTPFIRCVFGENYVFGPSTVSLVLAQFYLTNMRRVTLRFKEAMGLFLQDQYKALAETAVNLIASVLLAAKFGINGILAGTLADLLLLPFWIEPYILFRYGFKSDWAKRMRWYFATYLLWTLAMLLWGYAAWRVCSLVTAAGLAGVVIKGFVCTVLYGFGMLLCFGRTSTMRTLFFHVRLLMRNRKEGVR